jgi:hypothetical protein
MKKLGSTGQLLALILFPLLTGCGKFLSDAKIKSYVQDNAAYVDARVTMETGSFQMPALELPLLDPNNPGVKLGSFALRPMLGANRTEVAINVNLTAAANVRAVDGHYLPNGTKVPIGGIDQIQAIALPIDGKGTLLYLGLDTASKQAFIGTAIPIREFEGLTKYVGGLNIFPGFRFNDILAVAGIYTSAPGVGKNGLAVFVDAGSIFRSPEINSLLLATGTARSELRMATKNTTKLDFSGTQDSVRVKLRMYQGLQKLGGDQRGVPVTIGE